jgi:carboxypeptidase family protein/phosphoesterase family protein/galactose oxidase-like protein
MDSPFRLPVLGARTGRTEMQICVNLVSYFPGSRPPIKSQFKGGGSMEDLKSSYRQRAAGELHRGRGARKLWMGRELRPLYRSRLSLAVVVLAALLAAPGVGGASSFTSQPNSSPASDSSTFPTPIQHVFVLVMENAEATSVLANLTFERYLATTFSYDSQYYAICHPSSSNYIALTSGSTFSQCGKGHLATGEYPTVNIGDLADKAGRSWAGFWEDMKAPCSPANVFPYGNDSNAFLYYPDIWDNQSRCKTHDLTFSSWYDDVNRSAVDPSAIPNYALFVPNLIHQGHGTSKIAADLWLASFVNDWFLNRSFMSDSVLFITFDEGNLNNNSGYSTDGTLIAGGNVYLAAISPYSVGVHPSSNPVTNLSSHYNLLTTVEWLLGLGSTGNYDNSTYFPPLKGLFDFSEAKPLPVVPYGWTQVAGGQSPSARSDGAMTYDAADGYILLFGGHGSTSLLSDTWTYQSGAWNELNIGAPKHPTARQGSMISYDPACGCVILFGGSSKTGSLHDTWAFQAGTWTNITSLVGSGPPSRRLGGMDYDGASNELLLFGGHNGTGDKATTFRYLNDTWVLAGNPLTGGTWSPVATPHSPRPLAEVMLAYDPITQAVILFDGYSQNGSASAQAYNDTWSFSNGRWSRLNVASPPKRAEGSLAYDPSLGGLVLFGGDLRSKEYWDTWLWTGSSWQSLFAWPSPPPMDGNRLAYDPVDDLLVNFGGNLGNSYIGGTWVFAPISVPPPPYAVSGAVISSLGAIGGATVYANGTLSFTTTANSSGMYTLELGNGSFQVTAMASGYVSSSQFILVDGRSIPGVDFQLLDRTGQTYNVTGRVTNASGKPISNADVSYIVGDTPGSVKVNPNGYFTAHLPNGTYELTVSASGYLSQTTNVTVSGQDVFTGHFYLVT